MLTNLYKAFDCIPLDLLIVKLYVYALSSDSLGYIYSYLKDRKHCVQINNKESKFDTIIFSVLEGSKFGPILFNVFFCLNKFSLSLTSVLAIIGRISGNQFKCNYLRNQKFFLTFSLHSGNLHQFLKN